MNFITLQLVFLSLLNECISYSEYLEKYPLLENMSLKFNSNNNRSIKFNLVEIFSPFETFFHHKKSGVVTKVNQITYMFENNGGTGVITVSPTINNQEIWIRVVDITDIKPGGCTEIPDVVIKNDTWSISLQIKSASSLKNPSCNQMMNYSLYALPIFPSGNIQTWSKDYSSINKNKRTIVYKALNSSILSEYLKQKGDLLYSTTTGLLTVNFTLASRINRDFILIIVAYGANNQQIQYPPVYIDGCLTMKGMETSCRLTQLSYPMYLVLAGSPIIVFFAMKYEMIHVFFCSWIISAIVAFFLWRLLLSFNSYFWDTTVYVICFGIGPAVGIFFMVLLSFFTKQYNRTRTFFTSVVIVLILLTILWFTPLRLYSTKNIILFVALTAVVGFFLVIMFTACNYFTMTVGSFFICSVLMGLSISINNLNASIIPFIFIDFYSLIIYSFPNWIYYSPLLFDDLIIVIVCPLLSVVIGICFYGFFKRAALTKGKSERRHQVVGNENLIYLDQSPSTPHVPVNRRVIEPFAQNIVDSEPPPVYQPNPTTSNVVFSAQIQGPPPSYDTCVNPTVTPTAPVQNCYVGPCALEY